MVLLKVYQVYKCKKTALHVKTNSTLKCTRVSFLKIFLVEYDFPFSDVLGTYFENKSDSSLFRISEKSTIIMIVKVD